MPARKRVFTAKGGRMAGDIARSSGNTSMGYAIATLRGQRLNGKGAGPVRHAGGRKRGSPRRKTR